MPPHPAVFIRRSFVELHGAYDTSYQISGDYDSLLRYFAIGKAKVSYLKRVLVKMRVGGESNLSFKRIIKKTTEDYRALRSNQIGGIGALSWKNISKLGQFIQF
jgi:glycosyltransferase